jgi:hypothetical protein
MVTLTISQKLKNADNPHYVKLMSKLWLSALADQCNDNSLRPSRMTLVSGAVVNPTPAKGDLGRYAFASMIVLVFGR